MRTTNCVTEFKTNATTRCRTFDEFGSEIVDLRWKTYEDMASLGAENSNRLLIEN